MATIGITFIAVFICLVAFAILMDKPFNKKEPSMILAPIGTYSTPYNNFDLRQYFVDEIGNLYSANLDTWELNVKKKHDLLKCSNFSKTKSGEVVNSLRDIRGKKATIARTRLSFRALVRQNGFVELDSEFVTPRHARVHVVVDKRVVSVRTPILNDSYRAK